jgi:hypothetical protein
MVNLIGNILAAPFKIIETALDGVTNVVEGTLGAVLAPFGGETTPSKDEEEASTNQLSSEPA